MKQFSIFALILFFSFTFWGCETPTKNETPSGNLLIFGGGKKPDEGMSKFVELAGGSEAKIAVIPTASEEYVKAGEHYIDFFTKKGAKKCTSVNVLTAEEANSDTLIEALSEFSGFWFGGGDQNRLTKIYAGSKAMKLFHEKYKSGATIGGNSAGAAIMSKIMITGDGNWETPVRDSVITSEGFGFLDHVIIDQHFYARHRFNRLLNVVIENRTPGIGIDEGCVIWVKPEGFIEVIGTSTVLVLRTESALFPQKTVEDKLLTAQNLRLDIYKAGDIFRIH